MSSLHQQYRVQNKSLADLHEMMGKKAINNDHYYRNEKQVNIDGSELRDLTIDAQVRPVNLDLYKPADKKFAADWNETNALYDEAWDRYTRHRDVKVYRSECKAIKSRPGQ